ncbi:MAG TPA: hypothetical protein VFF30_04480 [Nitrososphaerales archaeon]|nr:hypothetical protein [Nitrososphaerales archaeon]
MHLEFLRQSALRYQTDGDGHKSFNAVQIRACIRAINEELARRELNRKREFPVGTWSEN